MTHDERITEIRAIAKNARGDGLRAVALPIRTLEMVVASHDLAKGLADAVKKMQERFEREGIELWENDEAEVFAALTALLQGPPEDKSDGEK